MQIEQEQDGNFKITWDESDPMSAAIAGWSEEEFKNLLQSYLLRLSEVDQESPLYEKLVDEMLEELCERGEQ